MKETSKLSVFVRCSQEWVRKFYVSGEIKVQQTYKANEAKYATSSIVPVYVLISNCFDEKR